MHIYEQRSPNSKPSNEMRNDIYKKFDSSFSYAQASDDSIRSNANLHRSSMNEQK